MVFSNGLTYRNYEDFILESKYKFDLEKVEYDKDRNEFVMSLGSLKNYYIDGNIQYDFFGDKGNYIDVMTRWLDLINEHAKSLVPGCFKVEFLGDECFFNYVEKNVTGYKLMKEDKKMDSVERRSVVIYGNDICLSRLNPQEPWRVGSGWDHLFRNCTIEEINTLFVLFLAEFEENFEQTENELLPLRKASSKKLPSDLVYISREFVEDALEKQNMTKAQLAALLGITSQAIGKWWLYPMSETKANLIAEALTVDPDDIILEEV